MQRLKTAPIELLRILTGYTSENQVDLYLWVFLHSNFNGVRKMATHLTSDT